MCNTVSIRVFTGPGAVTNLRVEDEGGKPKLMWGPPENVDTDALAGYQIEAKEVNADRYKVMTILCGPAETHYVYEYARTQRQ